VAEEFSSPSETDKKIPSHAEPTGAANEEKKMLDVRLPHVHAPHDEKFSWRGFLTHIAVVAIGLLLALGMEQGVEYIHHELQRDRLESEMRQTFGSNLQRADSNIKVVENFLAYLLDVRNAVDSRIHGASGAAPDVSDPRNLSYAPPPSLGPYEAAKINGSVSLLSLNRIRVFNRVEFAHGLMLKNFQDFFDSLKELRGFADRFPSAGDAGIRGVTVPNIDSLSAAQLVEYQAVLARGIENSRAYAQQLENLKVAYQLTLDGQDEDTLMDSQRKARRVH
jgi:hypothetical protein